MLYISIFTVFTVFIYLYQRQRQIIKYIPVSHKGLINLYTIINSENNNISLYKMYFNITVMFGLIIVMSIIFKLNLMFTITLIIVSLFLIPLIILWELNFSKEEFEFNNLVNYLNQFIMVFKSYPKIFSTLTEIENTISGDLNLLINESINDIKNGQRTLDSLTSITKKYPHFIVHNLHSLVFSIEQYGNKDYFDALDLIQDDIDDWVDDVINYNYSKKRIIGKVVFLIGFALVICFMAIRMLFSIDLKVSGITYQVAILVFCLIQIITYVMSVSLLNNKWIEPSEVL